MVVSVFPGCRCMADFSCSVCLSFGTSGSGSTGAGTVFGARVGAVGVTVAAGSTAAADFVGFTGAGGGTTVYLVSELVEASLASTGAIFGVPASGRGGTTGEVVAVGVGTASFFP